MENMEVAKVEIGLDAKATQTIDNQFLPVITERDGLAEVYKNMLTTELTPERCQSAGDLRRKLVKVRTGTDKIHKAEKSFYKAGGDYVDALRRKIQAPILMMEEKLMEMEKHYEILEKEKKQKLFEERFKEASKYVEDPDHIIANLGDISEDSWILYRGGLESAHNAQIKADREEEETRLEEERVNKIRADRHLELINKGLPQFIEDYDLIDLGTIEEIEFLKIGKEASIKKEENETEQRRIAKENDRLKKEADKAVEKANIERIEREEIEKKATEERNTLLQRNKARQVQLIDMGLLFNGDSFILKDVNFHTNDIITYSQTEWDTAIKGAAKRVEEIKKEGARLTAEAEAKNKALIDAKEEAERKIKDKEIEEAQKLKEEREAKEKALLAPDKEKLIIFCKKLLDFREEIPEMTTDSGKKIAAITWNALEELVIATRNDMKQEKM